MARALSGSGAKITLIARHRKRLQSVRDFIRSTGGTAEVFTADVTRENAVVAVAAPVKNAFGNPQILINNAGTNILRIWSISSG
jgi:NADP-dependent 3-hydroxy acid dehydrogenase YdfG